MNKQTDMILLLGDRDAPLTDHVMPGRTRRVVVTSLGPESECPQEPNPERFDPTPARV